MINNVTITGRLTKLPELRYAETGIAVCNFTVAINRTFTNKNGEREADFVNCVCFGKTAESLAQYQGKREPYRTCRSYTDRIL